MAHRIDIGIFGFVPLLGAERSTINLCAPARAAFRQSQSASAAGAPIWKATIRRQQTTMYHRVIRRAVRRDLRISHQQHKKVYSTRLHPLLCALTSAEGVAYSEQPADDGTPFVSGKFRSMLVDIFGRTYPENAFFAFDRDAVTRYKTLIRRNMAGVEARLEAIPRNVTSAAPA